MGLGKTVEILALILLHRPAPDISRAQSTTHSHARTCTRSHSLSIVMPPTLKAQNTSPASTASPFPLHPPTAPLASTSGASITSAPVTSIASITQVAPLASIAPLTLAGQPSAPPSPTRLIVHPVIPLSSQYKALLAASLASASPPCNTSILRASTSTSTQLLVVRASRTPSLQHLDGPSGGASEALVQTKQPRVLTCWESGDSRPTSSGDTRPANFADGRPANSGGSQPASCAGSRHASSDSDRPVNSECARSPNASQPTAKEGGSYLGSYWETRDWSSVRRLVCVCGIEDAECAAEKKYKTLNTKEHIIAEQLAQLQAKRLAARLLFYPLTYWGILFFSSYQHQQQL